MYFYVEVKNIRFIKSLRVSTTSNEESVKHKTTIKKYTGNLKDVPEKLVTTKVLVIN